ncbi:MAG: hemerythrin domain-containing protein [Caldisphaera sp.]
MQALTLELQDEHEFISKINSCLKLYKDKITSGNFSKIDNLKKLLTIIKEFVSNCHHKKEEIFIFPYMLEKGGDEADLANEMIIQHRDLEKMENQIEIHLEKNNFYDASKVLTDLVLLIDSHIEKENTVVFAYAEFIIDDKKKDELLDEIIKYEKDNNYYCDKNKYEEILEKF